MGRGRTMGIAGAGALLLTSGVFAGQLAFAAPAEQLDVEEQGVAAQMHAQPLAEGTPCSVTARACVDLDSQRAWLLDGTGTITRGPVDIASGGKGEETPVGHSLRVYRKEIDHVSGESSTNGVPDGMPYAVFFEDGGIAFHGGDPTVPSGGCVKLEIENAKAWFAHLQIGDQVQVIKASEEMAARGLDYDGPVGLPAGQHADD